MELNVEDLKDVPTSKAGWNDCTDLYAADKRKKSFRMFQKSPDVELLHVFSAGTYYGIDYFHVIHEDFAVSSDKPIGHYRMMTREEITEMFGVSNF